MRLRQLLILSLLIDLSSYSQTNKREFIGLPNEDSVTAIASERYATALFPGQLLFGTNYRKAWSTPVKLPVFYLSKTGFKIEKLGGSKETNSLYLKDSMGKIWVLRSVDKEVKRGIPKALQWTPFTIYKQNQVSASNPYAALVAAGIMKAAGINAPDPTYYYVAEDAALGEYQSLFANTMCMLERRDANAQQETLETDSIIKQVRENKGYPILKKELLKARLLDMIIGDWDRHEGQWRWQIVDSGRKKYYYAIPRDRDHALFSIGGVLPNLMKVSLEPYLTGFKKNSKGLKKLNKKAWQFDRLFLKGLAAEDWQEATKLVQSEITDAVIEATVNRMPASIVALYGEMIKERLKNRRQTLSKYIMDYYRFLFPNK
ncbi:MAG: hypothetical protein ACM3VS_09230 [Candidatus Dadabacteria bacterium]